MDIVKFHAKLSIQQNKFQTIRTKVLEFLLVVLRVLHEISQCQQNIDCHKMKLFFKYSNKKTKFCLNVSQDQTVRDIKLILTNHFNIDCKTNGTDLKKFVLEYNSTELNDKWYMTDLGIPTGSTLHCYTDVEIKPELFVFVKCQNKTIKIFEPEFDADKWLVLEIRVILQNLTGFPLSIFRLKTSSNKLMFDAKMLSEYEIEKGSLIILETWLNWDALINTAIDGYSKNFLKYLSSDELIKFYQMKAGLYIACHHGNFDLVKNLMQLGIRPDRSVGEHPCRQWCKIELPKLDHVDISNRLEYLKREYLRCPIHACILNGQLKVLTLIASTHIHALETKDGYGLPPWRLALHNNHKDRKKNLNQKEVARFLLGKRFGGKVNIIDNFSSSISFFARLKNWAERAKKKVYVYHGHTKSSLKKKTIAKSGLLGYKCLVDGYNNNFKDYINSYDRLRSKYKFYYFINQEERDKLGFPDLYFKTIGLIKESKSKNSNTKPKIKVEKPIPKTYQKWKDALNKIIFRLIVLKYADVLIKLGVEIDVNELSLDDNRKSSKQDNRRKLSIKLPPIKIATRHSFAQRKISRVSVSKYENRKIENETMKIFEQLRNGMSSDENAQILLAETSCSNRKWLKQVNLASKIAASNVKRLIKDKAHMV